MDDIIVIIITVIIALVGILNQQKKKKAAQQSGVGEKKQTTDFWDMIMPVEEVGEEEMVEKIDYEKVSEEYVVPETQSQYQFSATSEGSSDIKEELKTVLKEKKEVKVAGEKFSLKKAVIFSEILNRKYS